MIYIAVFFKLLKKLTHEQNPLHRMRDIDVDNIKRL